MKFLFYGFEINFIFFIFIFIMDVVVVGSCNIDFVRYVILIDVCYYVKWYGKCVVKRECGNIYGGKFIINLEEVLMILKIVLFWLYI